MKTIKVITIALLMTFLISCKDKIVCSQINSTAIKPLMVYDVSFKFNRCRGRCFDFNSWSTLPLNTCLGSDILPKNYRFNGDLNDDLRDALGVKENFQDEAINYPLEYCDELAGFSLSDMALEIRPKIKKLDQIKKDNCN